MAQEKLTQRMEINKLRTFVMIDDSKLPGEDPQSITGIQVSMWGDDVDEVKLPEGDVVGIKRCRTNLYRGAVQLNVSHEDDIFPRKELKSFKEWFRIFNWHKNLVASGWDFSNIVNLSGNTEGSKFSKIPSKLICQALHDADEIFYR